jgi:integrase/recombinase XerD
MAIGSSPASNDRASRTDASQAQSLPARPAPARRAARLRLPQRNLPAPARRTRRRGRQSAEETALRASEDEIRRYYQTVWTARRSGDIVLIKTLLYTGVRVAELVQIRLADVDLDACRIRITQGKGAKDRYVPFPATFKETLALHISAAQDKGAIFLFESSWKKPYSTRGVRAMLARYAGRAGLAHNMPPHRLRHFLFTWLKTQGIDDALIQPYSGHTSRTSLEIYSRLALTDAQHTYDTVIDRFPV